MVSANFQGRRYCGIWLCYAQLSEDMPSKAGRAACALLAAVIVRLHITHHQQGHESML